MIFNQTEKQEKRCIRNMVYEQDNLYFFLRIPSSLDFSMKIR